MAKKPRKPPKRSAKPSNETLRRREEARNGDTLVIIETKCDNRLPFVMTLGSLAGLDDYRARSKAEGRINPKHRVSVWKTFNHHPKGGELIDRFNV